MPMKNRSGLTRNLLCSLIILGWLASSALAAPPDNYTATMVMEGMSMPMAKWKNKTRMENPMMKGMVTIHDQATGKVIMYSSETQTYTEETPKEEKMLSADDPRAVVEKKKIGTEKIDGHPCIKYDAVIYLKEKPNEKYKAILWEAQDLGGLVIRQEMSLPPGKGMTGKERAVVELKDIKVGAAQPSMFEVPKGYRKVGSMMEMMGAPAGMEKQMQQLEEMMKRKKR